VTAAEIAERNAVERSIAAYGTTRPDADIVALI